MFDPPVSDPSQLETRDVPVSNGLPAYKLQADGSVHKLKNLEGIPIAFVTSESSGHLQGPEVVAFLKQAGCRQTTAVKKIAAYRETATS